MDAITGAGGAKAEELVKAREELPQLKEDLAKAKQAIPDRKKEVEQTIAKVGREGRRGEGGRGEGSR